MKKKILHFISLTLVCIGIGGLIWLNQDRPTSNFEDSFDPLLKTDDAIFLDKSATDFNRVAAIRRLCIKKNRLVRTWILENLSIENELLKKSMIEGLGYFPDSTVNKILSEIVLEDEGSYKLVALRALGTVENEERTEILKSFKTQKWSVEQRVQFHFSLFKSKMYFTDKKKNLIWLVDFAKEQSDGKLLQDVITGLAQNVPNFERYHELLKDLLYKSNDEVIVNRAIIHLSVYEKNWLRLQSKKIIQTKNKMKIKSFILRAGATCPKGLFKVFEFYAKEYSEGDFVMRMALSLNASKSKVLFHSLEKTQKKLLKNEYDFSKGTRVCY
ncbi:hypothetical protein A9Q84_11540 [Halobacteriovorax marinus]|uniref:HEAT repeat domain-containing protein n=1 Tax=Halobacteriovorax marinus TaxID=97084 RepID=A0A1Y5FED9_9BACT|nr:hypothetical protein A9Q84_11540 [Halobacteriovorax marinus]